MTIHYKANVGTPVGGDWYNTLVLSEVSNNNSAIEAKEYVSLHFVAPVPADTNVMISSSDPWIAFATEVKNQKIDERNCAVTIKIKAESEKPFVFSKKNTITIPFNATSGDTAHLSETLKDCITKITITFDQEPETEGKVVIKCASSPDAALDNNKPILKFSYGEININTELEMGGESKISLLAGSYTVKPEKLENADATVTAVVKVDAESTDVVAGQCCNLDVSFGKVSHFSAVDFEVQKMEEFAAEEIQVELCTPNQNYNFGIETGKIKKIRYVSPMGVMKTNISPFNINNKKISFNVPELQLKGKKVQHVVTREMVVVEDIDTGSFETVSVNIETPNDFNKKISIRLVSDEMNYSHDLVVKNQKVSIPNPIKPGVYKVVIENFIHDKIVHVVKTNKEFVVSNHGNNVLDVKIVRSANLSVRGFPDFLSFGGCTTFETNNEQLFVNARTSSIFKYAGTGGDGNPGEFLKNDDATVNTIKLARAIEKALPNDGNVLPVMISYTVQLSGGGTSVITNRDAHMHSFANYILALDIAQKSQDAEHPVPAGFIVNPDFLGECQKGKITADTPMPVRSPLSDALKHHKFDLQIPDAIDDTVGGYIHSVNWLTRKIAPAVTFGWQINLWGVGSSIWVYDNAGALTPHQAAKQTIDYLKSMKVYDGEYRPDFLAVDRYEADDLTIRSYANSYCYGPHEWERFYDFCAEASAELMCPVMPWQIPASRTPLKEDNVAASFEDQHWGTSANYLFGDAALGDDVENIHPTIKQFDFKTKAPATAAQVGDNPKAMYTRKGRFDVSKPAYEDLAKRGIFAILLGGGCTLGIVPPLSCTSSDTKWAGQKLNEYRNHPVTFEDTLK